MVRMTSDAIKPPEQRYGYSNALSGLFQIVKQEGVRGLTRGIEANTVRPGTRVVVVYSPSHRYEQFF